MTPHDFTIWLQGFIAALGTEPPTQKDWKTVTSKLASVTTYAPVLPGLPYYSPGVRTWPVTCNQQEPTL